MKKGAERTIKTAWLLDVDGVITDPTEKRVTQNGLLETIAGKLDNDNIVTLNTGRSISWLSDKAIFEGIEQSIKNKSKLSNFMAIGEKGGTWQTLKMYYCPPTDCWTRTK